MNSSFYIETFGCQMNKSDSELMLVNLIEQGYKSSEDINEAEIVIFNTCSVRQHAEDRAVAKIKSLRKNIKSKGGLSIVTGCMAQRIGPELIKNGIADIVAGPYQSPEIGRIITRFLNGEKNNEFLSMEEEDFSIRINPDLAKNKDILPWHKWITITHGCENYCSYCIVPLVRGKLISLSSETIIEYIKKLSLNGVTEITLLGQNVNQYGTDTDDIPFYRLLEKTAGIGKLDKINFLTSHPKDFSEDIIKIIKDNKNLSRSIHLPIQSGSDRILKLMHRKYNLSHYYNIVELINKHLANYSITTDIMVGFPGETENDFIDTLEAVNNIRFDDAFMYVYSPRKETPAYDLTEKLNQTEKIARLKKLIKIQREISIKKMESRVNRIEDTIIERISKKSMEKVMGKTFLNHPVVIPGSNKDIGKKLLIKIESIKGSTLQGIKIS